MTAPRITKEDLLRKLENKEDIQLIDVRNPTDYANSDLKIPGSVRIPLDEIEAHIGNLDRDKEVIAYCT